MCFCYLHIYMFTSLRHKISKKRTFYFSHSPFSCWILQKENVLYLVIYIKRMCLEVCKLKSATTTSFIRTIHYFLSWSIILSYTLGQKKKLFCFIYISVTHFWMLDVMCCKLYYPWHKQWNNSFLVFKCSVLSNNYFSLSNWTNRQQIIE